jgi:PAS domain-containing protein
VESRPAKHLVLILARELASHLTAATFITDHEGKLVFYNEPAEAILGRTFAEMGELSAEEWSSMFSTRTLDSDPMPLEQIPAGIALLERRAAHERFRITGLDGVEREISVTGIPLFAEAEEFVGVIAIFWDR